jgi:hypothetical protein
VLCACQQISARQTQPPRHDEWGINGHRRGIDHIDRYPQPGYFALGIAHINLAHVGQRHGLGQKFIVG